MKKHLSFISDLKNYLELCCKQSHENMANSNLSRSFSVVSSDVVNGNCPATTTFCRHTSFVARYLMQKMYNEKWDVAGGHCLSHLTKAKDTIKASHLKTIQASESPVSHMGNAWKITPQLDMYGAHWWLEKNGEILDLSADQFGHEPLLIADSTDERYIKDDSMCGATQLSSIRSTAMKWVTNDFGFRAKGNKYYEEINQAHRELCDKYPEFSKLQPRQELENNAMGM